MCVWTNEWSRFFSLCVLPQQRLTKKMKMWRWMMDGGEVIELYCRVREKEHQYWLSLSIIGAARDHLRLEILARTLPFLQLRETFGKRKRSISPSSTPKEKKSERIINVIIINIIIIKRERTRALSLYKTNEVRFSFARCGDLALSFSFDTR